MSNRFAMVVVLGALCASPGIAWAGDSPSLEELVIQMADTPAEHAAVAQHFRAKAEEARKEARMHEGMGRAYGGGKLGTRIQLQSHCDGLAKDFRAAAAEYDELAKLHDELAKAAPATP